MTGRRRYTINVDCPDCEQQVIVEVDGPAVEHDRGELRVTARWTATVDHDCGRPPDDDD
ncbi:MAG: hypothetical protein ACYCUG_06130 [Acidimicrobiales bacterium]